MTQVGPNEIEFTDVAATAGDSAATKAKQALSTEANAEAVSGGALSRMKEAKEGDMIREAKPMFGDKLFEKEKPLSKLENYLADNLSKSIRTGDLQGAQNLLKALSENPESAARVLRQVKREQEKEGGGLRTVNFVTGRDQDGNGHISMNIVQRSDFGKSSPYTNIQFDSRGNSSATYWKNFQSHNMDAAAAFQNLGSHRPEHQPQPQMPEWNYKKQK